MKSIQSLKRAKETNSEFLKVKEGIESAVCMRPLKNIRVAPIFTHIQMVVATSNAFKGLDYKDLC